MLNHDVTPTDKVPYVDLEYIRSNWTGGMPDAINIYFHKHKTDPDVIVKKWTGQRYDWLMGSVKAEK
jgi:hypothetical protein